MNLSMTKARYVESLAAYKAIAIRAARGVEEALTQLHSAQGRTADVQDSLEGYQAFDKAALARLSAGTGSVLELQEARRAARALAQRYGLPYNTGSLARQCGTTTWTIWRLAFPGGAAARTS